MRRERLRRERENELEAKHAEFKRLEEQKRVIMERQRELQDEILEMQAALYCE